MLSIKSDYGCTAWRNSTWHSNLAFLLCVLMLRFEFYGRSFVALWQVFWYASSKKPFFFYFWSFTYQEYQVSRLIPAVSNPDTEYSTCTQKICGNTTTCNCKYLYVTLSEKKWYWYTCNYSNKLNHLDSWFVTKSFTYFNAISERTVSRATALWFPTTQKQWAMCPSQLGWSLSTVLFGDSLVLLALDGNKPSLSVASLPCRCFASSLRAIKTSSGGKCLRWESIRLAGIKALLRGH